MITVNNIKYKDDFNDSNVEDKNYLRILFNGGRSVQIRELNQIQSILQSQIDKFGSSVYKQGSPVIGGSCTFDRKINTISVTGVNAPAEIIKLTQGAANTLITATVIDHETIGLAGNAITTFYVKYSSGGGLNSTNEFNTAETISLISESGNNNQNLIPSGGGEVAGAFLSEGVFFVNGSFVVTPKQNLFIPISDQVNGLTGSVVLDVVEDYVTYVSDQSLLDNATGMPNHLAPGADRYRITLSLAFVESGDVADDINRIKLLDISNSSVIINPRVRYEDIDRKLAQRTYEESGNYIVNPFKIEVSTLENSGRPGANGVGADEKVYIGLDPSVAYVDGYRIELPQKLDLTADRARTLEEKEVTISTSLGNFIDVTPEAGSNIPLPNTVNLTYELKNVGSTVIGTTRIKSIESAGASFRLFLYDINLNGDYNLTDIDSIVNIGAGVDLNTVTTVQNASNDTAVFNLPYENVKIISSISPEDFSYVIKKLFTGVVSGSANFTINAAANETFGDSSVSNFIVEVNGEWVQTSAFSVVTSSASSITITSSGAAWTPGHDVKVIFPVSVKTITTATKQLTTVTAEEVTPVNGVYTLSKADIFEVSSVTVLSSGLDITDNVSILSDGQRPSHYTNGTLKYNGSGAAPTVLVTYRYFAHNGLPFTINSYPIFWGDGAGGEQGANQIRFEDMPKYNGRSLGDTIDFRPTILAGAGTTTAIQPDPNSPITCKAWFFLPRRDKIAVNSNGEFKIISGEPSLLAELPATPPASLTLYELYFPAYTTNASDVVINYVDNRRYTMKDISKLDKRVKNLEYYTSLSLLESLTDEKQIFDAVGGFSRFKNGMLIDSFSGHGVGNVYNPSYKCSVDRTAGELRPFFKSDGVDLVLSADNQIGIKINENTITLDYSEEPLIEQLESSESESVNPYDVASFVGSVKLFPTNDKWVETSRRPDIIVNNDNSLDAIRDIIDESDILGTEWNTWETAWVGVNTENITFRRLGRVTRAGVTTTTTTNQTREGVVTSLVDSVSTQNLGDRVVDISFVPFIRSRKIYFHAKGLKPRERVYPFFDGIDISDYCDDVDSVVTSANLTSVKEYFNQLPGDNGFIVKSDLVANDAGEVIGAFIIPNNNELKFRTGERTFKLTNSPTNNTQEETTFAEGVYNASGSLQTIEATILSTRSSELRRDRITDARVLTDTRTRWIDPLAQTFIIPDIEEGAFATSIDLWFTSKSTSSIPVTVRLVAVDNGYPTQRTIPFSEVILSANDVQLWDVGPTTFTFSDPVYLKGGVEYAIVVLSNDPSYRIRVARLGGEGEDGKTIQQNPYGGVMFTSQNASTWSADQTRDIKFSINCAKFNTQATGTVEFKSLMREGVKSVTITSGGANYNSIPTVTFEDPFSPTGTRAEGEAIVDLVNGTVIGINITNPGSGYSENPSPNVDITGGGGTGAVAVSSMYEAPTSAFSLIQGSLAPEKSGLSNSLYFGSNVYSNIVSGKTYSPNSEFTITDFNRAIIRSTLFTTSAYITPVIELDSMTLLSIHNQVNSLVSGDTSEETSDGGNALSRYITREGELNDPADQLNIYLDVNRPTEGANLLMYVKLKYDSNAYSDWLLVSPEVKIPITDDKNEYNEVSYVFESTTNDFIAFSVKIVFTSTSTVNVASAKKLRIIATS